VLRDHPEAYPEAPYLAVVRQGNGAVCVAIRTTSTCTASCAGLAEHPLAAPTPQRYVRVVTPRIVRPASR
jgi:hypothetical protein